MLIESLLRKVCCIIALPMTPQPTNEFGVWNQKTRQNVLRSKCEKPYLTEYSCTWFLPVFILLCYRCVRLWRRYYIEIIADKLIGGHVK